MTSLNRIVSSEAKRDYLKKRKLYENLSSNISSIVYNNQSDLINTF